MVAGHGQRGRAISGPRVAAFVLAAALVVYLVLTADRAVEMIASGNYVFLALGIAIFVLPVLGVLVVADQLRFGMRTERLARRLDEEGALPDTSHLARRPSGRVEREAADAWFDEKREELRERNDDWRAWFAIAQAYDLAGDRNRGRKAMRHAIDLEKKS